MLTKLEERAKVFGLVTKRSVNMPPQQEMKYFISIVVHTADFGFTFCFPRLNTIKLQTKVGERVEVFGLWPGDTCHHSRKLWVN